MLRMTPNCLLRDFFQHLGHPLDVGWHGLKKRDPKPLHDAILGLPRQAQHEVEAGLSIVFELAGTAGVNAIREAARKNGTLALPPGYPSSKDPYDVFDVTYAALTQAKDNFRSTVVGHFHSQAGVRWWANPEFRVFGLSVGCGIDVRRLQFEYGRRFTAKPILGCGVVLDGHRAFFEPWLLKSR